MSPLQDDVETVRRITGALQRAGLRATAETISGLVAPRRKADEALARLKEYLDPRTEPAHVFRAGDADARLDDDVERR